MAGKNRAYIRAWQLDRTYPLFEKNIVIGNLVNANIGFYYFDKGDFYTAKRHFNSALEYSFDPESISDGAVKEMINRCNQQINNGENAIAKISTPTMMPEEKIVKGDQGGCFIATACFCDYNAPEVIVLRQYRDEKLLTSIFGRLIVKIYYLTSPAIAQFLLRNENLKKIVRTFFLKPIVQILNNK